MKYLGKDAAIAIEDRSSEGDWSEDHFANSEASTDTAGDDFMIPVMEGNEEEDMEFFDTVESQDALHEMFPSMEITSTSSHSTVLRVIDECCPCFIDMFSKRGKYVTTYAFQGGRNAGRPIIFRTVPMFEEMIGDLECNVIEERFSHRLASSERTRRALGLQYSQVLQEQSGRGPLTEFQRMKSPFDRKFLSKPQPQLKKLPSFRCGMFVARALSDRHWIEEWAIVTDQEMCFHHLDKTKPTFKISFSSIVGVKKVVGSEKCPLPSYSFLSVETFGRTHYLMFRSDKERDQCHDSIKGDIHANGASSSSFTNHLISVDEPMEEFLHKSSMWDCSKRKLLNCRRYSFKTPTTQAQPDSLELAEQALLKATALQPKGPDDADLMSFLDCAAALKDADAHTLNPDERLAFFLNLYHVMIMHAFIVLGPPDSSFKWITYFNNIGTFSLTCC